MRRFCLLGSGLLLLLLASLANATTYYVDNDAARCAGCTDSNSCVQAQTITTGKDTIASGAQCAQVAGDRVEVRGGTYTAGFAASAITSPTLASGTGGAKITLANYNGENVVVQPASGVSIFSLNVLVSGQDYGPDHWTFHGINTDGRNLGSSGQTKAFDILSDGITIEDLTISNPANNGADTVSHCVTGNQADQLTIQRVTCDTTHNSYGDGAGSHCVYLAVPGDDVIVQDSIMRNCGKCGIQYNDSALSGTGGNTGGIIRRNKIYNNNQIAGICLGHNQVDTLIYSNEIYNNGGNGVYVSGNTISGVAGGTRAHIYNNTIYGNTSAGIGVGIFQSSTGTLIKNNILQGNAVPVQVYTGVNTILDTNMLYANTNNNIVDGGTGTTITNSLTSNPLLVNPGGGDFHLQATSPALSAGLNLISVGVTTDIDGTTRTAPLDIGADERIAQATLHLAFTVPPTSAVQNTVLVPAVRVCANDPAELTDTSYVNAITLAIEDDPGAAVLTGGGATVAVAGCASFPNLSIDDVGAAYTLSATGSGATAGESGPFNITAPPAGPTAMKMFRLR